MRARRFRGEEELKLDSKARVSIPARFRAVLESQDPDWAAGRNVQMIAVYGDHLADCVECYTVEAMAEIDELIDEMEQGDPETDAFIDWYQTQAQDFSIDDSGRIVLPAVLRNKIGVEPGEPLTFVGRGKTFEIWKPEKFQASRAAKAEALTEEGTLQVRNGRVNTQAVFDKIRKRRTGAEEG
nr:cell division/cell wall cluster transcriptional repressor MraZ [Oceanicola sp. S124]